MRFNDLHTKESLKSWLRGRIGALAADFDLEVRSNAGAFRTAPGPLTEQLAAAVEEVTGSRPELNTKGGASDARFIRHTAPCVELGLVGATMHQTDERVDLTDIEGLTRIYEAFLRRFLGPA